MKASAVYPGTFDPFTHGHEDIVRRAARIFDRIVVAVAANPRKVPTFDIAERVELARAVLADLSNVEVVGYEGLTVQFAREHRLEVVVRGLRAVSDFEFEFQLANMGRHLQPDVETVFMFPWAVIFDKLRLFGLIEMVVFIFILVVGYYYAWQKGALEWA